MPDKPKRRKNNRNKRKNKNNQPDRYKSSSDVKESENAESSKIDVNNKLSEEKLSILDTDNAEIQASTDISTSSNNVCDTIENSLSQDLNNNSNDVQAHCDSLINKFNDEHQYETISDSQILQSYVVESPDHSSKNKSKLSCSVKSKSLDDDNAPKIVDITEESNNQSEDDNSLTIIDSSVVLVSDVDSDVEWENTNDINEDLAPQSKEHATGKISVTTIPLNIAHCEHTKVLTPEEELSLRNYLQSNLVSNPAGGNSIQIKTEIEEIINREIRHRLRKKEIAEDLFCQRLGPPRLLDVIDEEGSSESSVTSRRQSYLSDKKSDNEDLEDDVFEDKKKTKEKYCTKTTNIASNKSFRQVVPQQCLLVGTKIKEPEITEARGDWTVKTIEKLTGAEVVYLTDSSSSTSSIYDVGEETDDGVETDVSIRMITPTIEVTDTENLLKKTFVLKNTDISETAQENGKSSENNENKAYNTSGNSASDHNNDNSNQNSHEIVILSTENIKTNLYVKSIDESQNVDTKDHDNSTNTSINNELATKTLASIDDNIIKKAEKGNEYDLEIKVLKCELNDAINNLIKEVASDSETTDKNQKEIFVRQDSSSSVCSSQCTAKYNPTHSSLNDVSNIMHDDTCKNNKINTSHTETTASTSHVKDVIDSVTGISTQYHNKFKQPLNLRDLCVSKIATFPYGDKILEELAVVSERLQNVRIFGSESNDFSKTTQELSGVAFSKDKKQIEEMTNVPSMENMYLPKSKDSIPPPVKPRNSSLKKSQDVTDYHHWTNLSTKTEPVYVCLSPSQKMLMEKTNTVITKEDASKPVDTHKKPVDHKEYKDHDDIERKNEIEQIKKFDTVPLKSQTGSRLLALIQDPSVSNNIHSSINKRNNTLNQQYMNSIHTEKNMLKSFTDEIHSIRKLSDSFRPEPAFKPRRLSSSFYESDVNSGFTDNSLRSVRCERKFFHYSTGNLNKEIEDDISSIQNMHRHFTHIREQTNNQNCPRRPSLPKDLCDKQMEYIRHKEKELETENQWLEQKKTIIPAFQKRGPRAPLISEKELIEEKISDCSNYMSHKKVVNKKSMEKEERGKLSLFSSSQEEILRDKMYTEYINKMAERQERKQQKVIKITNSPATTHVETISKSMSALDILDSKVNNRIEREFISKARERWNKLGIKDPETEDEKDGTLRKDIYREPKVIEHKIKVIDGGEETDVQKLPSHLQEFVHFTAKDKEQQTGSPETVMIAPTFKARSTSPAVWRPGAPTPPPAPSAARNHVAPPPPPPPPVWSPGSAGASPQASHKPFRPVHFEDSPPSHRKFLNSEKNGCTSGSESEGRLRTSQSAPAAGLNTLGATTANNRLPRAQNPTVTLLQKAREGQFPRGSNYIQQERDSVRLPRDRASPPKDDPVYALRREYASEGENDRSDYERGGIRKMADVHRKVEGIGPTTKDGMPVALRSEVKDPSKWYKKMYDTIHKNKYDDDYVTIRYKSRRGQPPQRVTTDKSQYAYFDPRSGYLSEPEGGLGRLGSSTWSDAYDSDVTTGPRRRTASVQENRRNEDITSPYLPSNKYSTLASARASHEVYKNQPGKIENYVPGKSSVIDKEAKQQISSTTSLPQASHKEKKDLTSAILSKSNMARALKESGYESDSTLIFRRREDTEAPLSPAERRAAYKDLQAGGAPPLRGFRSPAPPRQESPRRYVESDVNIHYRCPVRHDPLPLVPERELARQQAEHMKRLYREQRRNKYLQELQDMQNRRHQDNFTPSQKTIVPLNRYDEADRVVARALYAFNGQTPRELSFKKGDLIQVRRQIDANWYEGELHGRIGLFPYNYAEILKGDVAQSPKKPIAVEGRARAKFDFTAQTNLELPLKKGEVVVLTRRIDQNWWEGKNGSRTGIFPDSYVTVLQEPSQNKPEPQPILNTNKPVASPAAHGLLNGSAKRSMGAHSYMPQPNNPALSNAPPATQPLPGYVAKPAQATLTPAERGYGPPSGAGVDLNNTEPLYVDTNAEAVPYRAMYKYRPQNPDELELHEGDTVYVLEKCDDGWYVGSSQRTGRFGTFPGNYVERI